MSKLILYNYFRSSTSYRARIALHHKNLEFEYKPVHLINNGGEQHNPEYRKLNPAGEVPTLVHEGKVLGQSFAIIQYLDEVFPQQSLFPKDSFGKAKVRQICEHINCTLHPFSNLRVTQYLEKDLSLSTEQISTWNSNWIGKGMAALETLLKENSGQFSYQDSITAADLFVVPQVFVANRFKVDTSSYPNTMRINQACIGLPAFKKAHPLRQVDTPPDMKIS